MMRRGPAEPAAERNAAHVIERGDAVLGIELGSTRIKACLIDPSSAEVLVSGGTDWENQLLDGYWTYALSEVWAGLQAAFAEVSRAVHDNFGVTLRNVAALGVSAMMHGYLAFDSSGTLLAPFRTWRNTNTAPAAALLSEAFGQNIPLRWSAAHYLQAIMDQEDHVSDVAFLTTLAGYVHWRLSGLKVLGVGDASGMFPIGADPRTFDASLIDRFDELATQHSPDSTGRTPRGAGADGIRTLLPTILVAGDHAGNLTLEGAGLLDPTGTLRAGARMCPPEGDAGTGMVATNSIGPRTGNVSVGTSIFAMVVLERALRTRNPAIDVVATPAGLPVGMVHCNNGASELASWAAIFFEFAKAAGTPIPMDAVFDILFSEALTGGADAGGLISYNYLSGEPIIGVDIGVPAFVRGVGSVFTLPNFVRAHLYGTFATLSLGMRALADEGVEVDRFFAHGGIFRTRGAAERFLAAALDAPVRVGVQASEGGSWGIAVLAAYAATNDPSDLRKYLRDIAFAETDASETVPDAEDVAGFASYLDRYRRGLAMIRSVSPDGLA